MKFIVTILLVLISVTLAFSQTKWQRIDGPETETVQTIFKDPVSGKFFASVKYQTYSYYLTQPVSTIYSSDDGINWTPLIIKTKEGASTDLTNLHVRIHKFIRYKDALMGFGNFSIASLDNGETWYSIGASGTWPTIVGDTLFSTEYSSKYFYKTGFTDYTTRITDSPLNDLLSNYVLSNMAESKGNLIVANRGQGTNVGIVYSEDYGRTFEMATFANPQYGREVSSFYSTDTAIYGVYHSITESSIINSTDGGKNWNILSNTPTGTGVGSTNGIIHGFDQKLFVSTINGLYRSEDGGLTWSSTLLTEPVINDLYSAGSTLFVAANNGIYRSEDYGVTFTKANMGMFGGYFTNGFVNEEGKLNFVTTGGEVFETDDEQSSWKLLNPERTFNNIKGFHKLGSKYILTGGNYLRASTYYKNESETEWTFNYPSTVNAAYLGFAQTSNSVTFNNTVWMYWEVLFLGPKAIFTATESSDWAETITTLPATNVKKFITTDTTLFAILVNDGLYSRTKSSDWWFKRNSHTNGFCVDRDNWYSFGSDSIYASIDAGSNWKGVSIKPNTQNTINSLVEVDGRYFILDNFNKILSTSIDTMKTWESHYATGEDNIDILFGHLNGKVYAASSEKTGIYVYGEAHTTSIDSELNTHPERIQLEQNYPNPFNPSTTIRFSLNKPSFVSLAVFDVLGNRVKQLVEANLSTGKHQVQFDANQLSSGMYFYRLQSGDFIETRKMLLIK